MRANPEPLDDIAIPDSHRPIIAAYSCRPNVIVEAFEVQRWMPQVLIQQFKIFGCQILNAFRQFIKVLCKFGIFLVPNT